jgi:hypothetical protein
LGVKDGRRVRLISSPPSLENVGASMSHNRTGLHGLLQGKILLFFINSNFKFCHWFDIYLTTLSASRLSSIDDRVINEYGEDGGMRIGRDYRSTRKIPVPVSFSPPQIPYVLTWNRI